VTNAQIEGAKIGLADYVIKTVDPYLDSIIVDIDKKTLKREWAGAINKNLKGYMDTINAKLTSFHLLLSAARLSDPAIIVTTKNLNDTIGNIFGFINLGKLPQAKEEVKALKKKFNQVIDPYLAIK
jgi:hypothetical protein